MSSQGNWNDAAHIRSKLVQDLLKSAGGLAPRIEYARLLVNGEYFGLYSIEESQTWQPLPEEDIYTEEGELLRLERRDGRKVVVKPKPQGGGAPNARTSRKDADCFKCGRKGHFARNCRSKKHKNGGPL